MHGIMLERHPSHRFRYDYLSQVRIGRARKYLLKAYAFSQFNALVGYNQTVECDVRTLGLKRRDTAIRARGGFVETHPELAQQWHHEKNGALTLGDVTRGSNKRVWWHCQCGYNWEASTASRSRGAGCPKCLQQRRAALNKAAALRRSGALATTHPVIAAQWHPTFNGTKTSEDYSPGSHEKIWWRCLHGHEWEAKILSRVYGTSCPVCARQVRGQKNRSNAISKRGSLASTHPLIARQWHPTKNDKRGPEDYSSGSNERVWWQCEYGHDWYTAIYCRVHGSACPTCYKRMKGKIVRRAVIRKIGSLATTHPAIAAQWHPTRNRPKETVDYPPSSIEKVTWLCQCGHVWEARIYARVHGAGCPRCYGQARGKIVRNAALRKRGSLARTHPEIAAQWHPTLNGPKKPEDYPPGSSEKVSWRCERRHVWEATINDRTIGTGCPQCRPRTSRLEMRLYCELKALWSDIVWRPKIGRIECDIYLPASKVGLEVDGFPWHAGKEREDAIKGERLLQKGIKLFRVRDNHLRRLSPTDTFFDYKENALSIVQRVLSQLMLHVSFSREDKAKIRHYLEANKLRNGREFREMLARLPAPPPEASLAKLHPRIAKEWNHQRNVPLEPKMFTPQSSQKVWWRCRYGHQWKTAIAARSGGTNCPHCFNQNRGELIRNAAVRRSGNVGVTHPDIAKQWHPTKNGARRPEDFSYGSREKIVWLCERGHEWETTINLRSRGNNCPHCYGQTRASKIRVAALRRRGGLPTTHPELVEQWHSTKNKGITPDEFVAGTQMKVWWHCRDGHDWKAQIRNRARGVGCPVCARRRRTKTRVPSVMTSNSERLGEQPARGHGGPVAVPVNVPTSTQNRLISTPRHPTRKRKPRKTTGDSAGLR